MLIQVFFIILFIKFTKISASNETTSLCNPNPCGPYSKCIDEVNDELYQKTGTPYCLCLEATVNKPPNCQFHCRGSDINCPENQFCDIDGKCEEGCRYQGCQYSKNCDCEPGEPCDCETKGYCSCRSNEYCKYDSRSCKIGCRSDINCKTDEYCDPFESKCMTGCRNDGRCGHHKYCDLKTRKCVDGCTSHEGCGGDEFCNVLSHSCAKIPITYSCQDDDECAPDEHCDIYFNSCSKGCNKDRQCHIDEYCDVLSKECHVGCRPTSCAVNEHCNKISHKCTPGCETDFDCLNDQFCNIQSRKCQKGCQSESSCKHHQYCDIYSKVCRDVCSETLCGSNAICTYTTYYNAPVCSCEPGYFPEKNIGCRPSTSIDQPKFNENGTLDCSEHCGESANCRLIDERISCFCGDRYKPQDNPFVGCYSPTISMEPVKTGVYSYTPPCECCGQAIKPECATQISAAAIATLIAG